MAQEGVVETAVVCDDQCPAKQRQYVGGDLVKSGRLRDHFVGNAGQLDDKFRNRLSRVDQLFVMFYPAVFKAQKSNFRHSVLIQIAAGRF